MKNMGKMLKQAKEMKGQMKRVQDQLKKMLVSGYSADKKIEVVMTGEMDVVEVKIEPEYLAPNHQKQLQKELTRAFNEASKKAKTTASSQLSDISKGLNIPGLS